MAKKDMKKQEAFEISDESLEKVSGGEEIYYGAFNGEGKLLDITSVTLTGSELAAYQSWKASQEGGAPGAGAADTGGC